MEVHDDVLKVYDELRLGHKWHYIIYKIENKKTIIVESKLSSEEKFEYSAFHKLVSAFQEPRFIVLDFHYSPEAGRTAEKVMFITWSPDRCGVQMKMTYAAAKEDFKKQLNGIAKAHNATDQRELEYNELLATAMK